MIIPILVATVASLGLGLILSDLLRVPSFAVSKSTHNLGKRQNKKTNPIELWLKEIAGTLAGKLKINEYKRLQLEADLRTADMPMTPEQYIANCIVKSGFVALFAIPLFFVSKLLALIALGASVLMYVNESRKVSNRIKERRRKIEADLPMLSSTIEKSLERSRAGNHGCGYAFGNGGSRALPSCRKSRRLHDARHRDGAEKHAER